MPFQVSPGVNITEKDLTVFVPGISSWIAGLAHQFTWGPVNQITTVSSENDLVNRFGKPSNSIFEGFFLAADFLAYSNNLKIVRVTNDAKNAVSGGKGTGLTVNTTALNGIISSITIAAAGSGYIVGDYFNVSGGVSKALFKVTAVTSTGGVTSATLVTGGTGYSSASTVATTNITSTTIKNDEDFDNATNLPEVIAAYPGALGNSVLFSAVRASEFDTWRYKDRFVKNPTADILKFTVNGKTKAFTLTSSLPSDVIVVADGKKLVSGSSAGQYTATSNTLTTNTATETFTANAATSVFTLTNSSALSTKGIKVTHASTDYPVYTGSGDVPVGKVSVVGNEITFGTNKAKFSGDGVTLVYTVTGVTTATADAKVKVDGVAFTVSSSAPSTGEVQRQVSGGNTTFTFNVANVPGIGNGNVVIEYGFLASGSITVEYGFPTDSLKVFSNQTGIHVAVADLDGKLSGTAYGLLETYTDLSLTLGSKDFDGTSNYYKDVINRNSNYARVSTLSNFGEFALSGGADDTQILDTDLTAGYKLFKNADEVDLSYLIGGGASKTVAVSLITDIAEYRRDCVAFITNPKTLEVQNKGNELRDIVAFKQDLPSSSYYHFANGWKYRQDIYNDNFKWVSCAGDHAGLYALSAQNEDVWMVGAGLNRGRIRNSIKLAWAPNKTERDELYVNAVNPTTKFTNEGPVLFGDKTGQNKPSSFGYMGVRNLFILLEKSIAKTALYSLFENNTEFTRNRFKNTVIPFLRDIKGRYGIEDYKVVCDESNNPGSVRQRKEFVGDILIKPVDSINYIQLNFVAVNKEVSFEEII